MTTIRWGIIGTSFISEVMAKAIQHSQTSELLAIASRSFDKSQQFAHQFSIPKFYDNYDALLNDEEIDAVYLGLPNHLHKEWIVRSALAGKHILCEKPLVISIEDAREVIATVEKSNVFCMEALMYRCHPFTRKLEELISNKIIGEVRLYNAIYQANIADIANPTAGGSIRNLGCYPVSLVRLLTKSEPIDIRGSGRMNAENTSDNQASVVLKFPNDVLAVISTTDDMTMSWQFDIYGTEGHLKVVTNPWLPNQEANQIIIYRDNEATPTEIKMTADKPLYTYQIDYVNQQILNNNTEIFADTSLQDSLKNTIVLETWLQQVRDMSQSKVYS